MPPQPSPHHNNLAFNILKDLTGGRILIRKGIKIQ